MLSLGAKHRPENVNTLINWIVCCCSSWQSPAILCPTRRFGGYFRVYDFLQPGEAPPGLEQTFPQLLAKGGKGLSQEVSPCWLQNPKWFIACLSGSYFKSQWFIESNAHILYNEALLQCCQHKAGTCCLFLLSSSPSKPTFHFCWGTLSMPIYGLCPSESYRGLFWFYITNQIIPYFSDFYASGGVI